MLCTSRNRDKWRRCRKIGQRGRGDRLERRLRWGSQEILLGKLLGVHQVPHRCRGVARAKLSELLLVRQLLSAFGFHELLVLEHELGVLVLEVLLLLKLQQAVSLLHLLLSPELGGGNALPGLFHGVLVDPWGEAGSTSQLRGRGSRLSRGRGTSGDSDILGGCESSRAPDNELGRVSWSRRALLDSGDVRGTTRVHWEVRCSSGAEQATAGRPGNAGHEWQVGRRGQLSDPRSAEIERDGAAVGGW